MQPESIFIPNRNNHIHALSYGDKKKPILFTCHGLTRNAWDFDSIAKKLAKEYHVVSFDVLGRGLSSWSKNPTQEYTAIDLILQLEECLGHFDIVSKPIVWFGTSMGGLLGMGICSGKYKDQFSHLILNDVAPTLNPIVVAQIAAYAAIMPNKFESFNELRDYFKAVHSGFYPMSDDDWEEFALKSFRRTDDGKYTVHYDPDIKYFITKQNYEKELWQAFSDIKAKIRLYLGGKSELILPQTIDKMKEVQPSMTIETIDQAGHVPMLTRESDIANIQEFLKS